MKSRLIKKIEKNRIVGKHISIDKLLFEIDDGGNIVYLGKIEGNKKRSIKPVKALVKYEKKKNEIEVDESSIQLTPYQRLPTEFAQLIREYVKACKKTKRKERLNCFEEINKRIISITYLS